MLLLKAMNWLMIPGKSDNEEPLYFCKATGKFYDKDGVLSIKQFNSDESESGSVPEGPFGRYPHFWRQLLMSSWKPPKPQSWTELATLYASKQSPGSWESDSEEEIAVPKRSEEITKTKQSKTSNKKWMQYDFTNSHSVFILSLSSC